MDDGTLLLGVDGQRIGHNPARPVTGATFELVNLGVVVGGAGRVLASGDAEAPDASPLPRATLVLDGPAGWLQASASKIPLATTAGLAVGELARIQGPGGDGEQIDVASIIVDDYARARQQLAGNYEVGATVQGLAVTAPVPDAVTGDEALLGAKLRIVWSYEIDGRAELVQQAIRLLRSRHGDGDHAAAIDFAHLYFPELAQQRRTSGAELDGWAKTARHLVEAELLARGDPGIEPSMILTGRRAVPTLAFKVLVIAAMNGLYPKAGTQDIWLKDVRGQYTAAFAALTVGAPGGDVTETSRADGATRSTERSGMSFGM